MAKKTEKSLADMTRDERKKWWEKKVSAALKGRTIVEVRYSTREENQEMDWYGSSIVLILDDGTQLQAAADDEGNGPGAIFTNLRDLSCIPTMTI